MFPWLEMGVSRWITFSFNKVAGDGNYGHLIITNWCIPSGDKVSGDGESTPVERAKDLTAFSYLVLVSFV
jgi:hypothetical protein